MTEYIEYTLDGVDYIDFRIGDITHTSSLASAYLPRGPYERNFPLF